MTSVSPPLPEYDNPPISEVAMAMQFAGKPAMEAQHLGLLWSKFRTDYSRAEQHPPLDPMVETLEFPSRPSNRIELSFAPPTPRCWFLNENGTELIQIQSDRIAHNWRKSDVGQSYPRYEWIRDKFVRELSTLERFLQDNSLGECEPNLCEITYINTIESGRGWDLHGEAEHLIALWGGCASDEFLDSPESVRLTVQYPILNAGSRVGRLHVNLVPAFKTADDKPIYRLTLTARGVPLNNGGIEGVCEFLDLGRETIVRGFTSVTTPTMHGIWRRTR